MLLYWGMFTVGFLFGGILSFVTFAPKKPENDPEYESGPAIIFKDKNSLISATESPTNQFPLLDGNILGSKRTKFENLQSN